MPGLSDMIELMIRGLLEENQGLVQIARHELASQFNCVPSQINYVISTRFTNQQGYYVESKRGGGGGIRITKIPVDTKSSYVLNMLNSMEEEFSEQQARLLLNELQSRQIISSREAILMKSAFSDKVFYETPIPARSRLRSRMMKNMLSCLMNQSTENTESGLD